MAVLAMAVVANTAAPAAVELVDAVPPSPHLAGDEVGQGWHDWVCLGCMVAAGFAGGTGSVVAIAAFCTAQAHICVACASSCAVVLGL